MVTILIDTREQLKLEFLESYTVVSKCLPVGDYSAEINGAMVPICYERKSLGDLYGTMTGAYDRFRDEIKRAKELNIKLVLLIEGTMREVQKGYKHCAFDGDSMLKKLATLYLKYDLEYHFCEDRREMARRIEDTFSAVDRLWKKGGNIECVTMR